MARNSGKRPHELTLELFEKNSTLTPAEIDAFVNNGPYASKHIWFLRKLGYDITVNKDGRTVVSYTYNGVGTATPAAPKPAKRQVADAAAAKQNKLRPARPTAVKNALAKIKEKVAKTERTEEEIRAVNLEKLKAVTAKQNKAKQKAAERKANKLARQERDIVEVELGSTGEISTSFSIDRDWDSVDGLDLRQIV